MLKYAQFKNLIFETQKEGLMAETIIRRRNGENTRVVLGKGTPVDYGPAEQKPTKPIAMSAALNAMYPPKTPTAPRPGIIPAV